jgi:hypothetical protein
VGAVCRIVIVVLLPSCERVGKEDVRKRGQEFVGKMHDAEDFLGK